MLKRTKLAVSAAILLTAFNSCKPSSEYANENEKANAFFQRVYDEELALSPMMQTMKGLKTNYGQWDDFSEEGEKKHLELTKVHLQFLQDSIDVSQLSKEEKLSYDLMEQRLKNAIKDYSFRHISYPVNQMHGVQAEIPAFLIGFHSISTIEEAKAYISRLEGITPLMEQIVSQLQTREEKGVLLPDFLYPKVLSDCRNIISGAPFEGEQPGALYGDFIKKVDALDIEDAKKEALKTEAATALTTHVKPAYEQLISVLEKEEKQATADAGVWRFEQGDEFYAFALQQTTTTDLTAEQIHEKGLQEVKRIHGEMRAIMEKVGFKGDLQEFFQFMKEDPQFYLPDTEEGKAQYLKEATALVDSIKSRLDEVFITKPKADMIVKRVEAFREKTAGKAFYNSPAEDGSRPGYYYANLYDMKQMPIYEMEALAFHEGIPGHHMQIAIAQELQNVPEFRKNSFYTAYVEGWGLYSEFVPKEMGFYSDPYSDFGRLAMELWRACRLVVDTGIHSKKWTREEGINYYSSNTPAAYGACEKMVDRHIVMPSQATAYKIGMLKILELRENAKKTLGEQFDIREFHDVVLTNGAVPLNVLEVLVQEWIDSKKS
ncbi:DUF885 domain-containing protein [Algivirga pacifica]|uniref:DUF885 domain-containing protein n=1 Tax=Algivirga pacifica TaxID=1162670 RepID=A0ABP9D8P4_9BACT